MPGSCEKIDAWTHLFVSCCSGVSDYILTYLQFNMRVPAVSVTLLNSSKRQPQDSTWNLQTSMDLENHGKHIAVEGDCFWVSKSSLFSGIQKKRRITSLAVWWFPLRNTFTKTFPIHLDLNDFWKSKLVCLAKWQAWSWNPIHIFCGLRIPLVLVVQPPSFVVQPPFCLTHQSCWSTPKFRVAKPRFVYLFYPPVIQTGWIEYHPFSSSMKYIINSFYIYI